MVGHGGGGSEAAAMSPPAGGGKRGRAPEEDVYIDNLHSHKRYLSEVMASSMNGLSVGDSVVENTMGSPVRLENASCFWDEMAMQYSPMSEESEDSGSCDTQVNTRGNQTDLMSRPSSSSTSSPSRFQKPHTWFSPGSPYPLPSCSLSAAISSNVCNGTRHESRIPSSPNDMCHGGDLRRTALLRSVQLRVQGPHPSDFDELEHKHKNVEGAELEQRSCPKSIQDADFSQQPERDADFVVEHRSDCGATSTMFNHNDIHSKLHVSVDDRR